MKNLIGHFVTITKHRHLVIKHCKKASVLWQGLRHDLSKYSPTEFFPGIKYYTGQRSPNEGERAENGYSLAWIHHKGRNRHHFEYWTDYSPVSKRIEPVEMPIKYVAEMFCDRVAAGKIYNGDKYTDDSPLEYFMKAKHRRVIHPVTSDLLESLLVMLKDYGEEYTFEYLRRLVKNDKKNKGEAVKK